MKRLCSLAYLTACALDVPQALQCAERTGYDQVGLRLMPNAPGAPYQRLLGEPALLREALAVRADTGVGVFDLEIIRIGEAFEPARFEPLIDAGAALGARTILVAGDDPDAKRLADGFARLCERLRPVGLTADLEFMPWTAVPDARAAMRVLEAAGRPSNAGILVDALHFARSATTLDDVRAIPREWLHYAQICDAPVRTPDGAPFTPEQLIHTARCERLLPGEGEIDLRGLFGALPADLPVSVEVVHLARMALQDADGWVRDCRTASLPFIDA